MEKYIFYKNGDLERPRNIAKQAFDAATYGASFELSANDTPMFRYTFSGSNSYTTSSYNKLSSLKNTINYYFGTHEKFSYENIINKPITFFGLSSYHLGNGLRRGSVFLDIISGSHIIDTAADTRENGILYNKDDNEVGFILYKEGFVVLSDTAGLSLGSCNIAVDGEISQVSVSDYAWSYFGTSSSLGLACAISKDIVNEVPTYMIFAYAEKGELNHSNNPTYLKKETYQYSIGENFFTEKPSDNRNPELEIKNTVYSPFNNVEAPFQKQTFISNIGLYDKNKKLIGVANLANPVKKTELREFLFKLKLDL